MRQARLRAKDLKVLGYSPEEIFNAPFEHEGIRLPQEKFFKTFEDAEIVYTIIDDILYQSGTILKYKNLDFIVYINEYWKNNYIIFPLIDNKKYKLNHFEGNSPKGFTKKRFIEIFDYYVQEYEEVKQRTDKDEISYNGTVKELEKLGFEIGSDKASAYFSNSDLQISLYLYGNGLISVKKFSLMSNNVETLVNLFKKLEI